MPLLEIKYLAQYCFINIHFCQCGNFCDTTGNTEAGSAKWRRSDHGKCL